MQGEWPCTDTCLDPARNLHHKTYFCIKTTQETDDLPTTLVLEGVFSGDPASAEHTTSFLGLAGTDGLENDKRTFLINWEGTFNRNCGLPINQRRVRRIPKRIYMESLDTEHNTVSFPTSFASWNYKRKTHDYCGVQILSKILQILTGRS